MQGKELDALRDKLEKGVKPFDPKDRSVQAGQPLAPGQKDIEPVVPTATDPPVTKPPQGTVLATAGDLPKGWADCSKTHGATMCDELAKTNPLPKGAKMLIKLPANGSVDDLNKFLDDVAASKQ